MTGCLLAFALFGAPARGQSTVTIRASVRNPMTTAREKASHSRLPEDASEVVVWLTPAGDEKTGINQVSSPGKVQLVQQHKSFQPHLLVVPVGTLVNFPNRDPFFHNVFSLFDGRQFDLGLYEAGATNSVRFDRVGVSFLFCNIHPEMSAIVVAVDTPYFAVSDRSGNIAIANVPDGKYELHVWYERSLPEDLKSLRRSVSISSENRNLGEVTVPEDPSFSPTHKNKYGLDYTPPPAPGYSRP